MTFEEESDDRDILTIQCVAGPKLSAVAYKWYSTAAFGTGAAMCVLTASSIVIPWYRGEIAEAFPTRAFLEAHSSLVNTFAIIRSDLFITVLCSLVLFFTAAWHRDYVSDMNSWSLRAFVIVRELVVLLTRYRLVVAAAVHSKNVHIRGNSTAITSGEILSIIVWGQAIVETLFAVGVLLLSSSHKSREELEEESMTQKRVEKMEMVMP